MRPDYLVIHAWGPYKDRVEIDFRKFQGKGLFLITGPTGAGKTTVFDAITYALYGSLSGEVRGKSSVRSDFAAEDVPTFVELTMTHGGKEYRIHRNPDYLRPKKKKSGEGEYTKEKENAVLYLPDGKIIEGVERVNAAVQDILVLSPQQFKQISMIAQGKFSELLTGDREYKIAILREIFGTGIYEQFTKNLREQAAVLRAKAAEQKHKLEEDIRLLLDSASPGENSGKINDNIFQTRINSGRDNDVTVGNMEPEKDSQTDVILKYYAALQELTEGANWNYEAIDACLSTWKKELTLFIREKEKQYGLADEKVLKLTENLTVLQEQNRKILQWEQALKKQNDLLSQEPEYAKVQGKLQKAEAALAVQLKESSLRNLEGQIEKNNTRYLNLVQDVKRLQSEKGELEPYYVQREVLEEYFRFSEQGEDLRKDLKNCAAQYEEARNKHKTASEEYLALEKSRDALKAEYELAEKQYKYGVIGIAAEMLVVGEPCPVCGSTEHPCPAKPVQVTLSEEELRRQKQLLEEKELELSQKQEAVAFLFAKVQSLTEQKGGLEGQVKELETSCLKRSELLNRQGMAVQSLNLSVVRSKVARYDQILGLVQSKEEERQTTEAENVQLKEKSALALQEYKQELQAKGFESEEAYHLAALSEQEKKSFEEKLRVYHAEVAGNGKVLEHLAQELDVNKAEHDYKVQDESLLQGEVEQAKLLRAEIKAQQEGMRSLFDRLQGTAASMKEKRGKLEKISSEYGYVEDLAKLASGQNTKSIVFEQYVLTSYFDEILRTANLRFSFMTGGRYEMLRAQKIADARTKDSLAIEVMDYYTGKIRSVKTLSGGETFKASLALALGFSDVVQAMNGGIRVDAMFVDEGFGSLDSESLDQACETLQGLVDRNRMIGIISHVQELRERIDNQIVVERGNQGSRVKSVTY